jgi:hypothetical protein
LAFFPLAPGLWLLAFGLNLWLLVRIKDSNFKLRILDLFAKLRFASKRCFSISLIWTLNQRFKLAFFCLTLALS